jgi:hypothetical protein
MIHNSSKAPVLIKKISLRIWSLRDEIETKISEELESDPNKEIDLSPIRNSYKKNLQNINNVVELKTGNDLDNSEDEMAKAMKGEDTSETTSEEILESDNKESDSNVVNLNPENSNIIDIIQNIPNIDESKIAIGKTVLSEITMDKMFFFGNKAFVEGQSIVIQFCIPKMFCINADVLYCRPFNLQSRIISKNNYAYRVLIKFTFLKDGERALLRQFIQSIEPDISKMEAQTEEDKKDAGFNELDDLGL